MKSELKTIRHERNINWAAAEHRADTRTLSIGGVIRSFHFVFPAITEYTPHAKLTTLFPFGPIHAPMRAYRLTGSMISSDLQIAYAAHQEAGEMDVDHG
jgi:hypothetical protein